MKFKIPTVLKASEILDKGFRRASKISTDSRYRRERRSENISKVTSAGSTISAKLRQYVKAFPSSDQVPPFYFDLIDLQVGMGEMKHSLGALDWAAKRIDAVVNEAVKDIKRCHESGEMAAIQKRTYGRISSIMSRVEKDLDYLNRARDLLKKMPDIEMDLPTVVIAGHPNVGKSTIIKKLSTAKPEVASYPFTTQEIFMGVMEFDRSRIQILDTPGLFLRPDEDRNLVELEAVAALRHLATLVVFVLDPTEYCGYSWEDQLGLLKSITEIFDRPTLVVMNKADMGVPEGRSFEGALLVSGETGEGLEEVEEAIKKALAEIPTEAAPEPWAGED